MPYGDQSVMTLFQNTHYKAKTQKELRGQIGETKKRKQEELDAAEETPAKIAATETDSES